MAWVPLQESEVTYEFYAYNSFDPGVTLASSIVAGDDILASSEQPGAWEINVPAGTLLRVTANSFSSNDSASLPSVFHHDQADVYNTNVVDNPTSWTPSPFETGETEYLSFQFGNAETTGSFQFLIEVWVADVEGQSNPPWWYCVPKPAPTPCPTRSTEFVPLAEYDADFKFPVASSRVPSKVAHVDEEGCTPCSPDLITPTDPDA